MLVGCSQATKSSSVSTPSEPSTDTEMFTERDRRADYDADTATRIDLNTTSSPVNITEEGVYVLSGSLSGRVIVDAPDTAKVQIVLDNATLTDPTSAALEIRQADKVFITLAENSQNTLENGGTFAEEQVDGALFSKADLTLNGTGSLTVISPSGHGIVGKDDLVITGGAYIINCASHGLDANDSIRVADASFTVSAGKDGLHAENNDDAQKGFVYLESGNFTLTAEGDGISAAHTLTVLDGTFTVTAGGGSENGTKTASDNYGGFMGGGMPGGMMPPGGGGGRPRTTSAVIDTTEESTSMKGLKSGADLKICGGTFTIDSADDAIHANASLAITGGRFDIASGDDGIHAEETLSISAGTIAVSESYEGLEALHVQVSGGTVKIHASDDGINAAGGVDNSGMFGGGRMGVGNGSIVISGGDISINASGDGIDANGSLEITGGRTVVCGPTMGDTATLDYDSTAVISGGTFIGTGASGMAQTFSGGSQGVIALQVGQQTAGTLIRITDSSGRELIRHEPELNFAVVILSSPDMVGGEEYTVAVGELSETFKAN